MFFAMRGLAMRRLLSGSGCLMLIVSSGCAMCANPYDDSYAAYGGRRERTDMVHGRVGSEFDPAPEIIHAAPKEQSPQPATPEEPIPDRSSTERPEARGFAPEDRSAPDTTLPESPEGTIELPEYEPDELPSPGPLPLPSDLPPDLPGNDDRSAKRHPLQDLFDEDF
jgi:hypothetical protein